MVAQTESPLHTPLPARPAPNPLRDVWARLVRPNEKLTSLTEQRHSRLLASIIIILMSLGALVVALLIGINSFQIDDMDEYLTVAAIALQPLLFVINRRGHYRTAAWLLIACTFALGTISPFFVLGSPSTIVLSVLTTVLAAYFFDVRAVSGLLIVQSLTLALLTALVIFPRGGMQPATTIGLHTNESLYTIASALSAVVGVAVVAFKAHLQGIEQDRRRELEQTVIERTAELAQAKVEAEEARDHALEADKMKSQFLASMSHELRTPLNSILTFTELMAMGTFGEVNDEQVDYLNKTLYSGKHLLSLINDVLDITKIHAGMMKLFIEDDFDVTKEVNAVVAATETMLHDKPVQLVTDIDDDLPLLAVDKRRIRQVMLNLVSNAVKFTEAGTITISAKNRPGEVLFAVIDTGPGIAEDQREIIFEPFIQTETGIKHAGGTGLGLPISRRLIEVHNGRMWVDSTLGEGSAFYFTLPNTRTA